MAKLDSHPGVSSRTKNGKQVWRYRAPGINGKQTNLPGQPGDDAFEEAYLAATMGKTKKAVATVAKILDARTVATAYRLLMRSTEWEELDTPTQRMNNMRLKEFMATRVADDMDVTWAEVPMGDIKTKHIRHFLESVRKRSVHAPKQMLVAIRKLTRVALHQDWIEYDPTFGLEMKAPPKGLGHRKWSDEAIAQFRATHAIGTQARTAMELAYWLGNRVSDVRLLRWDHLRTDIVELTNGETREIEAFEFRQQKNRKRTGGKEMFLPVRKELAAILAPLDRSTSHVLMNTEGRPYAEGSLTVLMRIWTAQAGLPKGHRLHGLRKNFGIKLAEDGATGPQIQNAMGHSSLKEADPYLQEANRKQLVSDAFTDGERRDEVRQRRSAFKVV